MSANDNKTPSIYHNNGGLTSGDFWWEIVLAKKFRDKSIHFAGNKPHNLDIILCHNYDYEPIAEKSLKYLGINDYVVLGQDVKQWLNRKKIGLVYDYIKYRSNAEYIMYLDSDDTIVCTDIPSILDTYHSEFSCDLLFNAEKNAYPKSNAMTKMIAPLTTSQLKDIVKFEREKHQKPFCFLNSGAYIGKRSFLEDVFAECLALSDKSQRMGIDGRSDQILLRYMHKELYPKIRIDDQRKIFQTTAFIKKHEFSSKYRVNLFDLFFGSLKYRKKQSERVPIRRNEID